MFSRFLSGVKKPLYRESCKSNFANLNINSIRNKVNDLKELIKGNIDVVMITETKIDASFTTAQFFLNNHHQPFRLDRNSKSGGIFVYIKSSVPSRKLKCDV